MRKAVVCRSILYITLASCLIITGISKLNTKNELGLIKGTYTLTDISKASTMSTELRLPVSCIKLTFKDNEGRTMIVRTKLMEDKYVKGKSYTVTRRFIPARPYSFCVHIEEANN